jgi:ATP-dependent DNA helicase RecG
MHNLGLKEPKIEERGNDVLVTIRHEALASPEQAVMRYLETHDTIRNKQAREITHIKDSDQMKRILSTMAKRGEIEGVPGARFGGMIYRKKQRS